jgi:hypothetical protein
MAKLWTTPNIRYHTDPPRRCGPGGRVDGSAVEIQAGTVHVHVHLHPCFGALDLASLLRCVDVSREIRLLPLRLLGEEKHHFAQEPAQRRENGVDNDILPDSEAWWLHEEHDEIRPNGAGRQSACAGIGRGSVWYDLSPSLGSFFFLSFQISVSLVSFLVC